MTARKIITVGQFVWVSCGRGQWREWQYSPARNCHGFVGQCGADRIRFALDHLAAGTCPNNGGPLPWQHQGAAR